MAFKEMVRMRKGMVEAILMPFFQIIDLLRFASTFRDARKMLMPDNKSCINFSLLFRNIFIDFKLEIPLGFF